MCLLHVGGAVAPLFMLLVQSRGLASDPAFYLYLIRISASVPYCPICFCIGLFLCLLLCFSASLLLCLLLCFSVACAVCFFGVPVFPALRRLVSLTARSASPLHHLAPRSLQTPSANKVLFGFLTPEL